MSSAKRESLSRGPGCGISDIMMLNRRGLMTLPWGSPLCRVRVFDMAFSTLTFIDLFVRKVLSHFNVVPLIFSLVMSRPVIQVSSYALARSRKIADVVWF